jgi:ribonuclease Z
MHVTHLHSDQITALNDLVTTFWSLVPKAMPGVFFSPIGYRDIDGIVLGLSLNHKFHDCHHVDLRNRPGIQVVVHEVSSRGKYKISDVRVIVG